MKRLIIMALVMVTMVLLANLSYAQPKLPPLDTSPADIAYLRPGGRGTTPVIKVIYGRPQKKGRTVLGEKDKYGELWRTGANESTEIKLYQDVTFVDQKVPAGTYTLYTIPGEKEWTIILNSKLDTWGPYEYDKSKDVIRVNVPTAKPESEVEAFSIAFDGKDGTGNMWLAWENTLVKVPLKF